MITENERKILEAKVIQLLDENAKGARKNTSHIVSSVIRDFTKRPLTTSSKNAASEKTQQNSENEI